MPFIISPKTTVKVIEVFTDVLALRKIPKSKAKFWHGNFTDFFYEGPGGKIRVLFTGYSGAVAGQAILEYAEHYLVDDPSPQVYFVGSVFAFSFSQLELGDLSYAVDTFSPDSFEEAIYKNAKSKGIADFTKPDPTLLDQILNSAKILNIKLKPTKVYCRISPGHMPNFNSAKQLMGEAMWWPLALGEAAYENFDSGEYESAAVLATSRLLGIPAVALLDVKDKRISTKDYHIATSEQKTLALYDILSIIREVAV